MENLKKNVHEKVKEILQQTNLSNSEKRDLCDLITHCTFELYAESIHEFSEQYHKTISEYETTRSKFTKFVEHIQESTKSLINQYQSKSAIKIINTQNLNKLKGNGSALDDTLLFLNKLNELVYDFYINVYKIEQRQQKFTQTTIF